MRRPSGQAALRRVPSVVLGLVVMNLDLGRDRGLVGGEKGSARERGMIFERQERERCAGGFV